MRRDRDGLLARALDVERGAAARAEIEARRQDDPALAAEHDRLAARWRALALPPAPPAPAGFAARVTARARAEARAGTFGLPWRPALARMAAVLLLAAGAGLGAALGVAGGAAERDDPALAALAWSGDSLADAYLSELAAPGAGEATP